MDELANHHYLIPNISAHMTMTVHALGGELTLHQYDPASDFGKRYRGYVEPADQSWCVFVNRDGSTSFYRRVDNGCYVNAEKIGSEPFVLLRDDTMVFVSSAKD